MFTMPGLSNQLLAKERIRRQKKAVLVLGLSPGPKSTESAAYVLSFPSLDVPRMVSKFQAQSGRFPLPFLFWGYRAARPP